MHRLLIVCLLFVLLGATGCYYFRATQTPIPHILYTKQGPEPAKCLVIFLPGLKDTHKVFAKQNFITTGRQALPHLDMAAVDAHLRYYLKRIVFPRIIADIIEPAQQRGVTRFWVVGVSLGGFGALHFMRLHPELIDGVFVLAPFLGDEKLLQEIAEAGGPGQWRAENSRFAGEVGYDLWQWLTANKDNPAIWQHVYLGYGTDDDFAPENGWLARMLPADHTWSLQGGHTWTVWKSLWQMFLRQRVLYPCPQRDS